MSRLSTRRTTDNTASPRVNPLVPETPGALFAEEWTINPHSVLPSFLEMVMIEEAQRSAWQTLKSIFFQVEDRIRSWNGNSSNRIAADLPFYERMLLALKVPQLLAAISEHVLQKYGPEIRFLMIYTLERKYLLSGAASISEALYGGKRVKLLTNASTSAHRGKLKPMKQRDAIRCAMLLVLGRYLLERGEWLYQGILQNRPISLALPIRFQKMFRFLYPFLYSSSKGLNLIQRFKYLLGESVHFDLFSRLLGLVVRRITAEDNSSSSTDEQEVDPPSSKSIGNIASGLSMMSESSTTRRIFTLLLSSAVGISWLARLQTRRQKIAMKRNKLPMSAPPKLLSGLGTTKDCPSTHCSLCRAPYVNPAASTSGYVFCLSCLICALRSKSVCPLTGKECTESNVIRLFEPNA